MKDKPESKKRSDQLDPGEIRCANPRYGGMTVAQATRRIMQGGKKESGKK